MASRRRAEPAIPGATEWRFTVRWTRSRKCLVSDPETTWRWSEPESATLMTRVEADAAAARMGGVVCVDGIPVDRLGTALPQKPPPVKGTATGRRPAAADVLRAHVLAGRWREATRLALKLRDQGDDKTTLERAWDGYTRPDFCRQLKRDPEALIAAGVVVLRRRFGAP